METHCELRLSGIKNLFAASRAHEKPNTVLLFLKFAMLVSRRILEYFIRSSGILWYKLS